MHLSTGVGVSLEHQVLSGGCVRHGDVYGPCLSPGRGVRQTGSSSQGRVSGNARDLDERRQLCLGGGSGGGVSEG